MLPIMSPRSICWNRTSEVESLVAGIGRNLSPPTIITAMLAGGERITAERSGRSEENLVGILVAL